MHLNPHTEYSMSYKVLIPCSPSSSETQNNKHANRGEQAPHITSCHRRHNSCCGCGCRSLYVPAQALPATQPATFTADWPVRGHTQHISQTVRRQPQLAESAYQRTTSLLMTCSSCNQGCCPHSPVAQSSRMSKALLATSADISMAGACKRPAASIHQAAVARHGRSRPWQVNSCCSWGVLPAPGNAWLAAMACSGCSDDSCCSAAASCKGR